MKKFLMIAVTVLITQAAMAFPSWMGTYGIYKKHDDRANPGLFSIMMNQDYAGLKAEVGIQVNGGNWVVYPMNYVANVSGNSLWTFMPSFQFPAGSTVKYYFHGTDNWGGNIWDTRNGLNYEFSVSPNPEIIIARIADGKWSGALTNANGITYEQPWNTWIDFKIKNIGTPEVIGMVWTWNNWASHNSTSASFEATLDGGFQQWGVDLRPTGREYNHRSLGFIRWFPQLGSEYVNVTNGHVVLKYALFYKANGTWYWDNNGGADYSIVIGTQPDPNDTDADGLLDSWEMQNFGNLIQTATDNPDTDSHFEFPLANIIEMLGGTDPTWWEDPRAQRYRFLWKNSYPAKGETIDLFYGEVTQSNPLYGKPVYAHIGHNGWKNVYQTPELIRSGSYRFSITVPPDATEINIAFTDKNGTWDNNGGKDWKILIRP